MKLFTHKPSQAALFCAGTFLLASPVAAQTSAGPNLIVNGDFEREVSQNKLPAAWSFNSANKEIFESSIEKEAERGQVLHLVSYDAKMSGYWAQDVQLKSKTKYRLSGLIKLTTGTSLIYLRGTYTTPNGEKKTREARIYAASLADHPLVPNFWKARWARVPTTFPRTSEGEVTSVAAEPNQWTPFSLVFDSGLLTTATVSAGAFFADGEYFFDDITLAEVRP